MTDRPIPILALGTFALLLAACEATTPASPVLLDPGASEVIALAPEHAVIPDYASMTEDERAEHGDARISYMFALQDASRESTWEDADRAVRAAIDEHPAVPAYVREQFAASTILRSHFLRGELAPRKAEVMGSYAELLFRNQSPDIVLAEEVLARLTPYWDDTRLAAARQRAIDGGERYLARELACDGCALDDLLQRVERTADGRTRPERAAASLVRLKERTAES